MTEEDTLKQVCIDEMGKHNGWILLLIKDLQKGMKAGKAQKADNLLEQIRAHAKEIMDQCLKYPRPY